MYADDGQIGLHLRHDRRFRKIRIQDEQHREQQAANAGKILPQGHSLLHDPSP
jgi:hypothetical protein